jgi:CRISPR/Cas system-associated exonuclease Cas4 (RecB family)
MIAEALADYAAATARTFEDREQTVGASEVGQCARKVYWTKNADDPAHSAPRDQGFADGWGAAMRGRIYEDHVWAPAMRARFGDALKFAGAEQQTFSSGFLSATPDGLVVTATECFLVECKTIDPRVKLNGPKPEHHFQVQAQLGLVRETTKYKPTHAVISYTDTSFWNEVAEFTVVFDPAIYETAKRRAAAIMTALAFDELKPEGFIAGSKECGWCPFTVACGRERTRVPQQQAGEADPQFAAEIADLARAAKELEAAADATTVQLRGVQYEIRERLRAKGLRRIVADGVSVVWSPVKGRQSFDMKRIREAAAKAGIDLAPYETVGQPTDRLVITLTPSREQQNGERKWAR